MKFLLVTYNDMDGVGQTVIGLNSTLNKMGHKSKTILLHKSNKNNDDVILIKRSFLKRGFFFLLELLKISSRVLFSFGNSTIKYSSIQKHIEDSDIIIIYTLHKFISFKMLSKILSLNKVVYLRPLDMELAVGGCHVNFLNNGEECTKFQSGCNNCPQLNLLNIFNISNKIFKQKMEIIKKYQPTILLENNFTKKFYDNSPVTKSAKNEAIFLTVKKERIDLIKKTDAKKTFQLDESDKVILFGTFNLDAPHKGGRILEEILKIFISIKKKVNNSHSNKIKLITFGRKYNFKIDIPEIEWIHLKEIFDDKKLNLLYRSSDVFVSPSTGCNGPATIREALVNDIPVVAFNKGEAEESVINGVNGYLVPCFDKNAFANSIYKTLFLKELIDKENKKEMIKKRYDPLSEANMIIKKALHDLKEKNLN